MPRVFFSFSRKRGGFNHPVPRPSRNRRRALASSDPFFAELCNARKRSGPLFGRRRPPGARPAASPASWSHPAGETVLVDGTTAGHQPPPTRSSRIRPGDAAKAGRGQTKTAGGPENSGLGEPPARRGAGGPGQGAGGRSGGAWEGSASRAGARPGGAAAGGARRNRGGEEGRARLGGERRARLAPAALAALPL